MRLAASVFARQGQTEWKRSVYGGCKKCTARNINVDGFSGEESVACLVVPCSPQRALPLAGKAGRRKKKKKRNVCVSVLCGSGYLLFTPLEGIQLVI